MPNLHLQIHPVFNPITSRVIIWDFRLRISDWWNRYALSIIKDRSEDVNAWSHNMFLLGDFNIFMDGRAEDDPQNKLSFNTKGVPRTEDQRRVLCGEILLENGIGFHEVSYKEFPLRLRGR